MSDYTIFLPEARACAAQCWCTDETSDIVMDTRLAEAVAHVIAKWMDTAAQFSRNEEYYRDLLQKCGELIGPEAYTANDGTVYDNVLCIKIPELVKTLLQK